MGGEEVVAFAQAEGVNNEHVRGGWVVFGLVVGDLVRGGADFFEGVGQSHGVAADFGAAFVGGVLAGAGDGHLY